ncbi:hypothetical protein DL238_03455 [Alteriqipengyuania lutimaris]|uniref:Tetratricopeptide repeat protein n=1 Tax=Alteriqipengyuania lutimaris TaxID=1538146 RepID=A0A395LK85_9SPHN|nr:hypothetical protein DL238_03455 [Alteriqipengyuania lutimaris]
MGLCALAYVLVSASFADILVRVNPERAHALAAHDGKITAAYALSEMFIQPDGNPNGRASQLAREALRQDPTAVDALTTLGFAAQLRNDPQAAMRAFAYSNVLSRRELRPQLFAIEEAVSRGDIVDALRHYDIALRTASSASELLFPTLSQAVSEPEIREALIPILRTDPVWREDFLQFAASQASDPAATRALFMDIERAGLPIDSDMQNLLVTSLFRAGQYAQAWNYYAQIRAGVSRGQSRDADFRFDSPVRTPFDWLAGQDRGVSASILPEADGGILDFMVPPEVGGIAVRQEQVLPPGSYRLFGRGTAVDQSDLTRPYWSLNCADGRELGRVELTNSAERSTPFEGRFDVPGNCPVQTLALIIRPTADIAGVSGQIDSVQLEPVD